MSVSDFDSSSDVDGESGEDSTGRRGLLSAPSGGARERLTSRGNPASSSGTELSSDGEGAEGDGGGGKVSGEGSSRSSVIVALPPNGSGKDSLLPEVVLTGSEALDVLDQVSWM